MLLLGVLAAGAAGAVVRALVHDVMHDTRRPLHVGTFAVNVAGSGLLGVLVGLAADGRLSRASLVIAGTGFCGALTTFSGFAVNVAAARRADGAHPTRAGVAMVVGCGVAAAVGAAIAGVR